MAEVEKAVEEGAEGLAASSEESASEKKSKQVEYPHLMRGILCAFIGACCWGFSGTCSSLMTSQYGIPVAWITCVRLPLAALLFFVIVIVKDYRTLLAVVRDGRSMMRIAGFGILGVLLTQVSYLSAIAYTNAGIGTVLERLGLIVIMFWTCFQMWRKPKLREIAGLCSRSPALRLSQRRASWAGFRFLQKASSSAW